MPPNIHYVPVSRFVVQRQECDSAAFDVLIGPTHGNGFLFGHAQRIQIYGKRAEPDHETNRHANCPYDYICYGIDLHRPVSFAIAIHVLVGKEDPLLLTVGVFRIVFDATECFQDGPRNQWKQQHHRIAPVLAQLGEVTTEQREEECSRHKPIPKKHLMSNVCKNGRQLTSFLLESAFAK